MWLVLITALAGARADLERGEAALAAGDAPGAVAALDRALADGLPARSAGRAHAARALATARLEPEARARALPRLLEDLGQATGDVGPAEEAAGLLLMEAANAAFGGDSTSCAAVRTQASPALPVPVLVGLASCAAALGDVPRAAGLATMAMTVSRAAGSVDPYAVEIACQVALLHPDPGVGAALMGTALTELDAVSARGEPWLGDRARATCLMMQASLRVTTDDLAGAREPVQALLELRPEDAAGWMLLADLELRAGDEGAGLAAAARAAALLPEDPGPHVRVAQFWVGRARADAEGRAAHMERARTALDAARAVDPGHADVARLDASLCALTADCGAR